MLKYSQFNAAKLVFLTNEPKDQSTAKEDAETMEEARLITEKTINCTC